MYKSIPNNLTNDELTSVVHYAIKILNKYKSAENKDVKFDKIPFRDLTEELNVVCKNLLDDEIDVESLRENDIELDKHINDLFALLTDRLKIQSEKLKQMGSDLLKQFSSNL
jgi:predicted lipid carrier protein YhbT